MRLLLLILVLFCSLPIFAQPGVAKEISKDGKKYYEHKIEEGNTLWGLQTMYGVSVETIVAENPSLTEGLKVDQLVYIPIIETASSKEEVFSDYKVKKSETLYGLSKKFNTTVDRLIELNPELSEGLQKGQVIKVPGEYIDTEAEIEDTEPLEIKEVEIDEVPNPFIVETSDEEGVIEEVQITFSDSTIRHTVLAHETMYSISKRFMVSIDEIMKVNGLKSSTVKEGQILIIPVTSERIEKVGVKDVPGHLQNNGKGQVPFVQQDEYTIALFLPLYLEYGKGYSEYVADLSTQFYMGVQLAIDSLEAQGINAKIHVFDTRNDSITVRNILQKELFAEVDLIIGPLMGKEIKQVAQFCKERNIRMVCPVASNSEELEGNPYFYSSVPSNISLINGLAKYLAANHGNDNIVLVKPNDKGSLPLYEAFRKTYNEATATGGRSHLVETTVDGFNAYIKRGVNTRFVIPSTDKSTAMKFMNNLNRSAFRSKADDLFVYGTKEWVNFTDVNNIYKNKYNFHYPSPNYLHYYQEDVVALNRVYRSKYKTDLTKMAVQGYDVMLYFCNYIFLENEDVNLIMNNFSMKQLSDTDGFENANGFIIEQEDFDLLNVGQFN